MRILCYYIILRRNAIIRIVIKYNIMDKNIYIKSYLFYLTLLYYIYVNSSSVNYSCKLMNIILYYYMKINEF